MAEVADVPLVETPTPTPETADPVIPADDETSSLSEHETAFGAGASENKRKIRHRSMSHEATHDDVALINQYAARVKAAEDAAGIARQAGESERVYRLRLRAELAEGKAAAAKAPTLPRPMSVQPSAEPELAPRVPVQAQQSGQTRSKPSEDEIGTKYAAYSDFVEDLADWKSEQRDAARQQQQVVQQAQDEFRRDHEQFHVRRAAFAATHPDYETLIQQHAQLVPPAPVYKAIVTSDNGPAFMYHLLTHPDQLAEVLTVWEGKEPTPFHVANAARWLTSRVQAATTGPAASTPPIARAPKPPNPVRTGPTQTGDEPPGDNSSLSDHEKAYGKRFRR